MHATAPHFFQNHANFCLCFKTSYSASFVHKSAVLTSKLNCGGTFGSQAQQGLHCNSNSEIDMKMCGQMSNFKWKIGEDASANGTIAVKKKAFVATVTNEMTPEICL